MRSSAKTAVGRRQRRSTAVVIRPLCVLVAALTVALLGASPALADPASVQQKQWWIGTLGLKHVWQISKGAGVTVAVLDTGVDSSVGDLRGALVPGFSTVRSGNGETDTDTDEYHGTRMAAEIAGRGVDPGIIGVAPQAKVMPVVVPNAALNDNTVTALDRLSAMAHPPQVVNMSYGSPNLCPGEVQAAVKRAVDKGMILVAAAGNEGTSSNASEFPANCAGVIAVGAFGAYGPTGAQIKAWDGSQRQPYVSLSAPGIQMITFVPGDSSPKYATGTSDSAAVVSGSIADVRAHFPQMSSRELVARMIATARQYQGAQGSHNQVFGWGVARPHHALTDTVPANAPNPIYDALDKVSAPSSGASTTGPSASDPAPSSSPSSASSPAGAASSNHKSSDSNTLVIVLIAVVAVAVVAIIGLVVRSRGRRVRP